MDIRLFSEIKEYTFSKCRIQELQKIGAVLVSLLVT